MYKETKTIFVIDNLAEIVKTANNGHYFECGRLLNGRVYHDKKGWIDCRLDCEHATEENGTTTSADLFAKLITDYFWSRSCDNKTTAYYNIKFGRVHESSAGILNRIYLQIDSLGRVYCGYCTGQDFDNEARIIRKILANK